MQYLKVSLSSIVFCPAFSFSLLLSISGPVIVSDFQLLSYLSVTLGKDCRSHIKFPYLSAFFFYLEIGAWALLGCS